MKNPFPGMNPFLEGSLWGDVHHNLISKIQKYLVLQISPKYVARVERYVVEDDNPESELGIMYPDVEIFLGQKSQMVEEPMVAYGSKKPPTPANLSIPVLKPVPVRIPFLKILDREKNELITAIEILSPVNKRKPGLMPYLQKRLKLHRAGVHFLEIDLLRRGTRTVNHADIEETDYIVALTRGNKPFRDVWTIGLKSELPVIPVPLIEPDEDVSVDLQMALNEVFKETGYGHSLDYSKTPPPPILKPEDLEWIKSVTSTA